MVIPVTDENNISCSELIDGFGLKKGDTVMVSSDLTMLLWMSRKSQDPVSPDTILNGIMSRIGEEGTLLIPTYNWDFCEGKGFDYYYTRCKTGTLGTAALSRSDFIRTKHPIYSFAVSGRDARQLFQMDNISSFGSNSPFAYLHHKNAINVLIDVDYKNSFTFTHYAEEQTGLPVPYRFLKSFTGYYTDENGITMEKTYTMLVRSYELKTSVTINPMGEILEAEGIAKKYYYHERPIRILRMGEAYPYLVKDITENRSRNICTYISQN